MTRILVTGSRDWSNWPILAKALFEAVGDYGPVVVVSGRCPTGADAMAEWVTENLLRHMEVASAHVEPHPADWSKGRGAGPERNKHMVSLGADVCLAFIGKCSSPRCKIDGDHPSHGASGTADMAEAAGIPTRRFYA